MIVSNRLLAFAGVLLVLLSHVPLADAARMDPSGRVARLSHVEGDVSYSPAGENEWLDVMRNRPLVRGDSLWTNEDARLELQVGSAVIRLGPETNFKILDLNDRIAQVQVTEGTINLRVRRLDRGQTIEVATPTLAFTINRAGRYRLDVAAYGDDTTIVVWEGAGTAYGEYANFPMRGGDTVRFFDTDLRDYEVYRLPRADEFDRYCLARDQRLDRSPSLRYVGDDVIGYSDLDDYGRWSSVRSYGNVWFPSQVERNWAPYSDGHWVWQEPWGWTWIDTAPWGFAPSHYGRWVYVGNRWGWIPGPRNMRATYAPALVAFVGGNKWSVSMSYGNSEPIGWFPLGPREAYVPSYRASRDYFTRVNINNTVINNTTITNIYNNYASGNDNISQSNYANRAISGAVTAVPSDVFVNARSVRQAAMKIDDRGMSTGEIRRTAKVAPSLRSVLGANEAEAERPPNKALERRVLARNAPPAEENPFATRERELKRNPGQALESAAANDGQGKARDEAQQVHIINDQRAKLNAREAGSTRKDDAPPANAGKPAALPTLDRSAPAKPAGDRSDERTGRTESKNGGPPPARPPAADRDGKADEKTRTNAPSMNEKQNDPRRDAESGQPPERVDAQKSAQDPAQQKALERKQQDEREQAQRQAARDQQADKAEQAAREREAAGRQKQTQVTPPATVKAPEAQRGPPVDRSAKDTRAGADTAASDEEKAKAAEVSKEAAKAEESRKAKESKEADAEAEAEDLQDTAKGSRKDKNVS